MTQLSTIALLTELAAQPGVSGHEDAIIRTMADHFGQYSGNVRIDSIGNVSARFGPDSAQPLAVLAHIDTVGFAIKQMHPDGTLGVVQVGGANLKSLPGTAVRVGDYPGLFGVRSQHLATPGDAAVDSIEDLYIEIDPQAEVEITTPVTYAPQTLQMGAQLFASPYMDNRAGCAVLLELARLLAENPPEQAIYLIGTVQEETSAAGAFHALQTVAPSAAIFVDGTVSYDRPTKRGRGAVALGAGPVLTSFLYVSGLNGWHANPKLRAHLKHIATAHSIPFQQDAVRGLMSDSSHATELGIPSALVGLPMRGKHSPLETIHLGDLDHASALVFASAQQPLPDLSRG